MNHALSSQGWSRMVGLLDSEKCSEIIEEAGRLDLDGLDTRVDLLAFETRVWRAESVLESVNSLTRSSFISQFETLFAQRFSFAIYNKIVPGTVGSGGGWHRDTRLKDQFKLIIYLTDCPDAAHGSFQYVPKSHGLLNWYRFLTMSDVFVKPRYSALAPIFERNSLALGGAAGDSILVNTTGIHRGNPVKFGERHALTFYFDTGVRFESR